MRTGIQKIDLQPLEPQEIRAILDRNFSPNSFPPELSDALWRATDGRSAALAATTHRCIGNDALLEDRGGTWHLPSKGIESIEVVRALTHRLDRPIREALEKLDAHLARRLREFLELAAMSGSIVPADYLLAFMSCPNDEREVIIDTVDQYFLADGVSPLFADHAFRYPGVPDCATYQFLNPVLPGIILQRRTQAECAEAASEFLRFLTEPDSVGRRQLEPETRAKAQILMNLTEHTVPPTRNRYRGMLTYWIGIRDADLLEDTVARALQECTMEAETVLTAAEQAAEWPPSRRLALISGYGRQPDGVPLSSTWRFFFLRAAILKDLAHFTEALPDAEQAVAIARTDKDPAARLPKSLSVLGLVLKGLGRLTEARASIDEAQRLLASRYGPNSIEVAIMLRDLAAIDQDLGDYRSAYQILTHVLQTTATERGTTHRDVGQVLASLGWVLASLGRLKEARGRLEEAVAVLEIGYGPNHIKTSFALVRLGLVLFKLGLVDAAASKLREALEIQEQIYGPEHLEIATLLANLAAAHIESQDYETAQDLLRRSLEITEATLGSNHPAVGRKLVKLGVVALSLNRPQEAREYCERGLAIAQHNLGPDHPEVAAALVNLATAEGAQGLLSQARRHAEEALTIEERAYGSNHPELAPTLAALAGFVQASGDTAGARSLLDRAATIASSTLGINHPMTQRIVTLRQNLG